MKVIKADAGYQSYQRILKELQVNNRGLLLWQHISESGERKTFEAKISSINFPHGLIVFALQTEQAFNPNLPVYCYSEFDRCIFKSSLRDQQKNVISVKMPTELRLLEESELSLVKGSKESASSSTLKGTNLNQDPEKDYLVVKSMQDRSTRDQEFLFYEFNLSLDEEDKIYADKRQSPRARPKVDKWVKLRTTDSKTIHTMKLFDLSQGGIAFVSNRFDIFPKGSMLIILGFDEFDLDDVLIATVMSHRPIDGSLTDFKIGCKFNEGQD